LFASIISRPTNKKTWTFFASSSFAKVFDLFQFESSSYCIE
jgi:hypothetical protein